MPGGERNDAAHERGVLRVTFAPILLPKGAASGLFQRINARQVAQVAVVVHAAAVDVAVFHFAADEVRRVTRDFAVVFFVEQYRAAQALRVLRLELVNDSLDGDAFVEDVVNEQDVFARNRRGRPHFPDEVVARRVVAVARGVQVVHAVEEGETCQQLSGGDETAVHDDEDERVQSGVVQVQLGGEVVVGGVDAAAVDQAFAVAQDGFEFLVGEGFHG